MAVNIIDKTKEAGFGDRFGQLQDVQGIVIHHTAGGGDVGGVINTFKERNFPAQYVIDQQGNVYQTLPSGAKGQQIVNGVDPSTGRPLNNANTIGIEVIGKNDAAWTPAQIEAVKGLTGQLQQQYGLPQTAVYGHSEVNPKDRTNEGAALAQSLRTGAPYAPSGDPYGGNPFGVKPTQVATAGPTPPLPTTREAGGQSPLYAGGGLLGGGGSLAFQPQRPDPFAGLLSQADYKPQPPAAPPQSPTSAPQGPDILGGGMSPLRTYTTQEAMDVPSGPYGADALVKAAMAGDEAAIKKALGDIPAAAVKDLLPKLFGGGGLTMDQVTAKVSDYFGSVGQVAPGAVRQAQTSLNNNPALYSLLAPDQQKQLKDAFTNLPPMTTGQVTMPNLRPPMPAGTPQTPPLVAANQTPDTTPRMAAFGLPPKEGEGGNLVPNSSAPSFDWTPQPPPPPTMPTADLTNLFNYGNKGDPLTSGFQQSYSAPPVRPPAGASAGGNALLGMGAALPSSAFLPPSPAMPNTGAMAYLANGLPQASLPGSIQFAPWMTSPTQGGPFFGTPASAKAPPPAAPPRMPTAWMPPRPTAASSIPPQRPQLSPQQQAQQTAQSDPGWANMNASQQTNLTNSYLNWSGPEQTGDQYAAGWFPEGYQDLPDLDLFSTNIFGT